MQSIDSTLYSILCGHNQLLLPDSVFRTVGHPQDCWKGRRILILRSVCDVVAARSKVEYLGFVNFIGFLLDIIRFNSCQDGYTVVQ